MTRRAVVSSVIRVQRRYAVRIRPMESRGLVNVGQIFELFIEVYITCTHFSYIEYVLRIHLVKLIRRAVVSRITGVEEICRPNPTYVICGLGSFWIDF